MAETDELSLDEALSAEEPAEDATGETEEVEAKAEEAVEETETEDKADTETDSETPAETKPKTDEEPWHVKAVMTEREKRQAAERELAELRKKLETEEREQKPKTSVFDNEDDFRSELLQEFELERQNDRYAMSKALAVDKFGEAEVDKAMETFKGLVESDSEVGKRIFESPLPYFEMMKVVEKHEKAKELENIDDYREKIRAEEREKVRKELEAEQDAKAKKREGLTPSLASARSSGGNEETDHLMTVEEVLPT